MEKVSNDPAKELEQRFWSDAGNAHLRNQVPVRASVDYYNEFIIPEIMKRATQTLGGSKDIDFTNLQEYVVENIERYNNELNPENPKNENNSFDPSGRDIRDQIPALVTRDLVVFALKSELLGDLLKEMGEVGFSDNADKIAQISELGNEILEKLRNATPENELFFGIRDFVDFKELIKKVYGAPYGPDLTSLRFVVTENEQKPSIKTIGSDGRGYQVNRETISNLWLDEKLARYKELVAKVRTTDDPSEALRLRREAVSSAVELFRSLTARDSSFVTFNFIVQESVKNMLGRVTIIPNEWGVETQGFNKKESDGWAMAREIKLINQLMIDRFGYGIQYSWKPGKEKRAKILNEWLTSQRQQGLIGNSYKPNFIKKLEIWLTHWNAVGVADADNMILLAPEGFWEKFQIFLSGMKFVALRERWGLAPTPAGLEGGGLKEFATGNYAELADAVKKDWNKTWIKRNRDSSLLSVTEYRSMIKQMIDVNKRWTTPANVELLEKLVKTVKTTGQSSVLQCMESLRPAPRN
jgi:hypothetical protein